MSRGLGRRPTMTNQPAPPPTPPPPTDYRLQLNNWLQHRGWNERFRWDNDTKDGPDHNPTWHALCRCPSTSLPVYLMLTRSPQLMVNRTARVWVTRSTSRERRLPALLSVALFTGREYYPSSNARQTNLLLNHQPHLHPTPPGSPSFCHIATCSSFLFVPTPISPFTSVLATIRFVSMTV